MTKISSAMLIILLFLYSPAIGGGEDALLALERIRTSIDSGISYDEYSLLLESAKSEIVLLKQSKKQGEGFFSFLKSIELSYEGYGVAKIIWNSIIVLETTEEQVKTDHKQTPLREKLNKEIQIREKDIQKVWWAAGRSLDLAYERRG